MTDLRDRTGLVTGAGNGLGRAIAHALAKHCAHVVLAGRDMLKLERVAGEIRQRGGSARPLLCDVADPRSVDRALTQLPDDEVSILVNNAGIPGPVAALVDVQPGEWDGVFGVNVRGVYLMCRAFLPQMIKRGTGDVINIASVSGKRPLAGRTPYTASKMAVIGLTATLAHEVGPLGVRVNSLSPGPVRGPRMDRNFQLEATRRGISEEAAEEEFVARSALRRMVTNDEVGAAVVAMLGMPGLSAADIDLSAGMVAR